MGGQGGGPGKFTQRLFLQLEALRQLLRKGGGRLLRAGLQLQLQLAQRRLFPAAGQQAHVAAQLTHGAVGKGHIGAPAGELRGADRLQRLPFQKSGQYILILIPNFFGLLLKYGVDALFKAHMKIYLFTISSLISLGVRILFFYIFVSHMGLLALAVATVVGNAAAILFNWTVKKVLKY